MTRIYRLLSLRGFSTVLLRQIDPGLFLNLSYLHLAVRDPVLVDLSVPYDPAPECVPEQLKGIFDHRGYLVVLPALLVEEV
jgi:hypothetical protein